MQVKNTQFLIGNTPLVQLRHGGAGRVWAKLEMYNPFSVKDRAALFMINAAEQEGKLKPGGTIVEPTSGNTGIGLAFLAAVRGYTCILTMPESMSPERVKLLKSLGANIILTPADQGMQGAVAAAQEILRTTPGAFLPDQFSNPNNALAHEKTTGPEIWNDLEGKVDVLVAGVGTGGTLSGIGRFLKKKNPAIKVVAVEPADSPLLSTGKAGAHKLQGIGANFVPSLLDRSLIDQIITVTYEQARQAARQLIGQGIFPGISGAAATWAALSLAAKKELKDKNIVVILPDGGERYLSTPFFEP